MKKTTTLSNDQQIKFPLANTNKQTTVKSIVKKIRKKLLFNY